MAELVQQASMVKALAHEVAAQRGAVCDFSAKPYASDYGSALHLHVHVENEQGENLFYKRDDALSDALRFAVSGLLAAMPDDMHVFAPQHESKARFVAGFHAPVNTSWGFNNRTTALRIPDGTNHCVGVKQIAALVPTHYRRIEHRVAGADADVDAVIVAVLRGVCAGLLDQQEPPEPIYGDAVLSKDIKSFVL